MGRTLRTLDQKAADPERLGWSDDEILLMGIFGTKDEGRELSGELLRTRKELRRALEALLEAGVKYEVKHGPDG